MKQQLVDGFNVRFGRFRRLKVERTRIDTISAKGFDVDVYKLGRINLMKLFWCQFTHSFCKLDRFVNVKNICLIIKVITEGSEPLSCGFGSILEDVSKVRPAVPANDLGSDQLWFLHD